MIDLDGLKRINDDNGHAVGDDVLRQLATALRSTARIDDGVYRMGGDEFLIVAPDTIPEDLSRLIERLRESAPAFSAGVAGAPEDGESVDDLLAAADARLYERKPRRRPPSSVRRSRGAVLLAPLYLASVAAEAVRTLFDVPVRGGRLIIWSVLLLASPVVIALSSGYGAARWGNERRVGYVASRALILLLAFLAALVPIVGVD
jgi:hypothetical protein